MRRARGSAQVALGGQQLLDQAEGRGEEDRVAALDEGVARGRQAAWLLPTPGRPKARTFAASSTQPPAESSSSFCSEGPWQARLVEGVEGLARGEVGGAAQPLDAPVVSLLGLHLEDVEDEREGLPRGRP